MARFVVVGINNHNLRHDDYPVNTGDFIMFFTVWVGGVEITDDYYVTDNVASRIVSEWIKKGYTDIVVERVL